MVKQNGAHGFTASSLNGHMTGVYY